MARAWPSSPTPRSCRRPTGPRRDRPGCAPMRAHTLYEQVEHDQPGTPARIHTWAHAGDLAAMQADIRAARSAGRRGAGVASLGHPLRARRDRRLPARSGARGDRGRRRCHPRAPRAYPQGHRVHRRPAGVLQPVQLRHRPAHDARACGAPELPRDPEAGRELGTGFRQPLQLPARLAPVDDRAAAHRRRPHPRSRLPAGVHRPRRGAADRRAARCRASAKCSTTCAPSRPRPGSMAASTPQGDARRHRGVA